MLVFGLDLGQQQDYSALAAVQVQPTAHTATRRGMDPTFNVPRDVPYTWYGPPHRFDVVWLERFTLGTPYPAIVDTTLHRCKMGRADLLAIDAGGVGRGVLGLFHERGVHPLAVTITGGNAISYDPDTNEAHAPKADLISTLQVALQAGRISIARQLPEAETLTNELQNYRYKLTASANETFDARSGAHDDLVLACAIACWSGTLMSETETHVVQMAQRVKISEY